MGMAESVHDPAIGHTEGSPSSVCSMAMGVAPDDNLGVVQAEGRLQGVNDVGLLQAPVRIEHEAPRRRFVDDPAARPLVVLGLRDAIGIACDR
jgi:hypothetical protein